MTVSWQPTRADYHEVVLLCARRRRRTLFGLVSGLGLLAVVAGLLADETTSVAIGVGLLFYVLVLSIVLHFRAGAGFWKHDFLRAPKTALLSETQGLVVSSSDSTGTYAWSAFAACQETEHLLVLRLARSGRRLGAFLIIPKRAFAGPAEVERTRELIRAVVGSLNRV